MTLFQQQRRRGVQKAEACKPGSCENVCSPCGRVSPSVREYGHSGANYPRQKLVRQRPEAVEQVKAVKAQENVFAGESTTPLPAALRYGESVRERPMVVRTLCHSHTQDTAPGTRGLFGCESATPPGRLLLRFARKTHKIPRIYAERDSFSTVTRAQPSWVGGVAVRAAPNSQSTSSPLIPLQVVRLGPRGTVALFSDVRFAGLRSEPRDTPLLCFGPGPCPNCLNPGKCCFWIGSNEADKTSRLMNS
uniref:Uncharacterized protein n=1 Tax=Knipowitschia caucasica TaxID=637954 RepID=A0AAV2LKT4_KNICA